MDTNTKIATVTTAPLEPAPTAPTARSKSRSSLADILQDWTGLLAAVADHGTDLGAFEPLRSSLQTLLDQGRNLSAQQSALTANSQVATKQLKQVLRDGQTQASRLRAGVKSQFGYTDEKLVQFGSRPLRRRVRATKLPVTPVPAPE